MEALLGNAFFTGFPFHPGLRLQTGIPEWRGL
jgi:hypothetical protein